MKIHINQIRPMDAINCMMKCNPSSPDWITPGVFFGLVHFLVIESVYCCLLLVTCGYADVHTYMQAARREGLNLLEYSFILVYT